MDCGTRFRNRPGGAVRPRFISKPHGGVRYGHEPYRNEIASCGTTRGRSVTTLVSCGTTHGSYRNEIFSCGTTRGGFVEHGRVVRHGQRSYRNEVFPCGTTRE